MTRLISQVVPNIGIELEEFDLGLREKPRHTLLEIGCHAAGIAKISAKSVISSLNAAVVPITCSRGIIA